MESSFSFEIKMFLLKKTFGLESFLFSEMENISALLLQQSGNYLQFIANLWLHISKYEIKALK